MAPLEDASCSVLDQHVRALAEAWASHELELSCLVLRFHRADGWRRLGYATETHYARERLGLSRSSFVARRALALRLERLPAVAAALGTSQIGVEAAVQLVRIATPNTEAAWIERARKRTIKHLREEVAAALTAVRVSGESDCLPPGDTELVAFHMLEHAVVSGRFGQFQPANLRRLWVPASEERRAWCVMLGSLASWLESGLQMSAAGVIAARDRQCASTGRVALRLRMSRHSRLVAHARSPGAPLAASWDELAPVPVLVRVARLAPSPRHGRRIWSHLRAGSVSLYESRLQSAGRHASPSPVPLGGR